jgi:hypothetical protein
LLSVRAPSSSWSGAAFSSVFPPLFMRSRVLAVIDGVYYFEEVPHVPVRAG